MFPFLLYILYFFSYAYTAITITITITILNVTNKKLLVQPQLYKKKCSDLINLLLFFFSLNMYII